MIKLSSYTGGVASTNGWLVQTASGNLLIDAPEGIGEWLRQQGVKLTALLLTHQHFDHVMDAAALREEHHCPLYAFAPHSPELTLERLFEATSGIRLSVPVFTVDHVLQGTASLSLCGLDFKLLHVPGHSPDSLCFYDEAHSLVFGGDVLFAGSIGRTDLPGGDIRLLFTGIAKKLLVLPDDTRILPGHGPETTIGDERCGNPFLDS